MGLTACTEPRCLYKGDLYLDTQPVTKHTFGNGVLSLYHLFTIGIETISAGEKTPIEQEARGHRGSAPPPKKMKKKKNLGHVNICCGFSDWITFV